MKVVIYSAILAATLPQFLASESTGSTTEEETPEELPSPEAYRRGNYNPRPSYDPHETYENLRRGSGGGGFRDREASRYSYANDIFGEDEDFTSPGDDVLEDKLKHLLSARIGDPYERTGDLDHLESSPSGYQNDIDRGGHGGGYGLTCTTGYINASAVALLAFLFLLNILQDVITQITGGGRRRRRDTEDDYDSSPLDQFLGFGGMDALKEGGPTILLNLMVKLSDATEPKCFLRPLCEANYELVDKFGVAGRVIGSLMSNIVSQAYSGGRADIFDEAQSAASLGRQESCETVPICPKGKSQHNTWDMWNTKETHDNLNHI